MEDVFNTIANIIAPASKKTGHKMITYHGQSHDVKFYRHPTHNEIYDVRFPGGNSCLDGLGEEDLNAIEEMI